MKSKGIILALAAMLSAPAWAADGLVAFPTSVKLVLDAEGVPRQVEVDQRLPVQLREHLASRLGQWRFVMPEGVSGAVTYAALGVCLAPSEQDPGALSIAYNERGHGPRHEGGELPPPRFPMSLLGQKDAADIEVEYIVLPDGRVQLERIDHLAGVDTAAKRRDVDRAVRQWAAKLRYEPEQLAGGPVGTRLRTPFQFTSVMMPRAPSRDDLRQAEQRRAATLSECVAAADGQVSGQAVALDSRLARRTPEG